MQNFISCNIRGALTDAVSTADVMWRAEGATEMEKTGQKIVLA